MAHSITRNSDNLLPQTATSSSSTTCAFALGVSAGAIMLVDSKSAGGNITITWYTRAADGVSGEYQLVDSTGAAISQTVTAANQAFALPDGLFAARVVLPVVSSGTAVLRLVWKS